MIMRLLGVSHSSSCENYWCGLLSSHLVAAVSENYAVVFCLVNFPLGKESASQ